MTKYPYAACNLWALLYLCQGTHTDLVVQIVLIAESMRLQAMMATYGIQTQTPHEVEPVQILSSTQLVKVYQKLGVNKKLNLHGRPARPIGSLGTSKVCVILYFFLEKKIESLCMQWYIYHVIYKIIRQTKSFSYTGVQSLWYDSTMLPSDLRSLWVLFVQRHGSTDRWHQNGIAVCGQVLASFWSTHCVSFDTRRAHAVSLHIYE